MLVPLASTGLRAQDIQAAIEVLESGNLTMGARVKAFESQMAKYLKVEHFIMVNSGSSANLAIIESLMRPAHGSPKLQPGDGVLVPAIAWPTTIWPLVQLGLKAYFVDVDVSTIGIDLAKAQEVINQHPGEIKAIFPIHPLGRALNPAHLKEFALNNNLIWINDVCESLGSWEGGIHAGTSGLAGSFSFYFSHHITTMEGGGIATNDSLLADDLRSIRSHGWSRDRSDVATWTSEKSKNDSKFLFVSAGYNIRPMEIQAAIGSVQLGDIDNFIEKRRLNAQRVADMSKNTALKLIGSETFDSDVTRHSWMMLPFLIQDGSTLSRDQVVSIFNESGIDTRPVLTGNFLNQPSMKRIAKDHFAQSECVVADKLTTRGFLVGNHHDFNETQIERILETLQKITE